MLLNEQITCIDGGAILSVLIISVKVYVCLCDGARRNNARPRQTRKLEHSQISDIDDNGIKKRNMSRHARARNSQIDRAWIIHKGIPNGVMLSPRHRP